MSPSLYGLMAEFAKEEDLLDAIRQARQQGYTKIEAYAPYAVEGLAEAIGFQGNRIALITLIGGMVGGVGGYFMQWYAAVISYPINIGGRPLHSWPMFIPITFELTILVAAFAAVFGMLIANGLPRLYHPVFNVPEFDLVTRNRFFICISHQDQHFNEQQTFQFLKTLAPIHLMEVPQ